MDWVGRRMKFGRMVMGSVGTGVYWCVGWLVFGVAVVGMRRL